MSAGKDTNMADATVGTVYSGGAGYGGSCGFKHDGNKVVWMDEKRGISLAGARGSSLDFESADLVIDCAGLVKQKSGRSLLKGPAKWLDKLLPTIREVEVIEIDWPDYSAPWRLRAAFWQTLYREVPDGTRIVACCVGSHGRTGTALAALVMACWAESGALEQVAEIHLKTPEGTEVAPSGAAAAAVRLLRAKHCKSAVESEAQHDYLAELAAEMRAGSSRSPRYADILESEYEAMDIVSEENRARKAAVTAAKAPAVVTPQMTIGASGALSGNYGSAKPASVAGQEHWWKEEEEIEKAKEKKRRGKKEKGLDRDTRFDGDEFLMRGI